MADSYLKAYADQCVLITGGAGAIGSNLSRALLEIDAKKVVVLDDLSSAERWNLPPDPRLLFVHGSVVEDRDLKRVFGERPWVLYHLAALFANQNSIDHPENDLLVNGMGTSTCSSTPT